MSYEQKYLKYKQKYLELKRQLESQQQTNNNMSSFNLTETPTQTVQKQEGGGIFSFFLGKKKEDKDSDDSNRDESNTDNHASDKNYDLTDTPTSHTGYEQETEVIVGPVTEMKQYSVQTDGFNLTETPTIEQSGGFLGSLFGSDMAPVGEPVDTTNCAGVVNAPEVAPVETAPEVAPVETAPEVAPVETAPEVAPVETAPEVAPVETAPEVAPVETAPEVAPVETAPEVAPVETAPEVAPVETAPEVAPVETAPEVAPVETAPEVAPVDADSTGRKILSQYKDEINNTEDIEKLFSQLGGNLSELNTDSDVYSESSYNSDSEQLSLTLS
jgi:hypothetical protein